MSTYLVTGALGFIGRHLSEYLAASGEEVVAVDIALHENSGEQKTKLLQSDSIEYLEIDLCSQQDIKKLPDVDGIFHLAALNGTQNFYDRPWQTLYNSTLPTLNLLQQYAKKDLEFFFYAGSSEAYAGTISRFGGQIPTPEEIELTILSPRQLRWSYGGSKLHGEISTFAAAAELGIPGVVGRFHNVYGPDMGIHHVIPDFISRGRNGVYSLYGADQTRSFIYVSDAVKAVVELATNAVGEIINIGSPVEISMRHLATLIMDKANWKGEIEIFDAPQGSVERRAPDVSKLSRYIDVEKFVSLELGIEQVLKSEGLI